MLSAPVEVFYNGSIALGESMCWHPLRQTMWWVDITGQRIFEAELGGAPPRIQECGQLVGAVAPTAQGGLIGAFHQGIFLLDPESGRLTSFAAPAGHDPARFRFNDGKIDPQGRFWAGTMSMAGARAQAQLYRCDPDGSIHPMVSGVSISNGLAWSLDGTTLYYIDSPTLTVQAFAYEAAGGTIGPPKIALQFSEADGLPDGCAMDAEGRLWVAHWGGGQVTCSDPRTGRRIGRIEVPVRNVTSCAFGGAKLDRLFITTAAGEDPAEQGAQDGFVFHCRPGVAGAPLASFGGTGPLPTRGH